MDKPPNIETPGKKSVNKFFHMFFADIIGNVVELAYLKYQDKIDEKIPFVKAGFKSAMYLPIKLIQTPLEWTINNFGGNIEGDEAREHRKAKTSEERLDGLLDSTYHYASAIAVGWTSLVVAEKAFSKVTKTPSIPGKMWTRVDLPVHVGMAAFLGSSLMKPATGTLKEVTKKILLACGWTEEKAEQDSRFTMAYILPNYATLVPTIAMMSGIYKAEAKGLLKDVGAKDFFGFPEHHFVKTNGSVQHPEFGVVSNAMLKVAQKVGVITTEAAHAVAH